MLEMLLTRSIADDIPSEIMWSKIPFGSTVPRGVYSMGFTSAGNDLYCYGGQVVEGVSLDATPFWKFNTLTNVYTPLASPVNGLSRGTSLTYANGRLFAIGAVPGTNLIWYYTIADGTWRSVVTPYQVNASQIATVVRGNRIYCIGGNKSGATNTVFYIDAATLTMGELAPLPVTTYGGVAFTLNNTNDLYYYSGYANTKIDSRLFKYFIPTNTWVELPPGPVASTSMSVATVNNVAYVTGIISSGHTGNILRYSGDTWKEIKPQDPPPSPRYFAGSAGIGDLLYIYGGRDGSYTLSDLWRCKPV